ncbi:AraC family transcriptional regulator [Clostridium estertheticum]|uniref:AraC family transcriptional regulator n=1 Tax=Clostridium estertheticum TaxID=238834 RepID=UPI001C0BB81A|nr:AraC family transcriptional regulator [Clostridium estertheticum]MBU3216362.1 AraC family transcriptional regulator [Clostridium estertheticum]WAG55407.1 AraC family transcriptional regulator [Clostridium estertheticum]
MRGSFEKTVLEPDFPFRLFLSDGFDSTPHHWHEDIEIIYLVEGSVKVGVGNDLYHLKRRDILIIGPGEVHFFLKEMQTSNRAVIQFRMSIYDAFLSGSKDIRTIRPMFTHSKYLTPSTEVHSLMEKQIQQLINENTAAKEGYKLIMKARLYDLAGILIRYMPKCEYSAEAESRQIEKLQKLDKVFQYVDKYYQTNINLEEISKVAGFSLYYFTRFFKENTGVTFVDYLNNFRITKAEWHLMEESDSITEVAYKSGFNSIKTFNRVFKKLKGCAPMQYRKGIKSSPWSLQ